MIDAQLKELLLQSLEHERGGVLIYETALACAVESSLKKEWQEYLDQTRRHVAVLTQVCRELSIDPAEQTPGCRIVHHNGTALVVAMQMALAEGDPVAAQLVACESVVLAETKDHADWQLIGECAAGADDQVRSVLQKAYDQVEDQEDEHLYHTKGWCRELWLKSLGLKAVLPPPEERAHVKTAVAAARAASGRG
jgi:hypothetical protein